MKEASYPMWKKYVHIIPTSFGTCTLEYLQASAEDTYAFFDMIGDENFKPLEWLLEFIKKRGTFENNSITRWRRKSNALLSSFFHRIPVIRNVLNAFARYYTRKVEQEVNLMIVKILADDRAQSWYNKIVGQQHYNRPSLFRHCKEKRKDGRRGLYGSNVASICEKFNVQGVNDLFKHYTQEQIGWMTDSLIFDGNEYSDEGKSMNDEMFFLSEDGQKEYEDIMSVVRKYSTFEQHKKSQVDAEMKKKGFTLISSDDGREHV